MPGAQGLQGPQGVPGPAGVSGYVQVREHENRIVAADELVVLRANCPAGTDVFGGGAYQLRGDTSLRPQANMFLLMSSPADDFGWVAWWRNTGPTTVNPVSMSVYAICAKSA